MFDKIATSPRLSKRRSNSAVDRTHFEKEALHVHSQSVGGEPLGLGAEPFWRRISLILSSSSPSPTTSTHKVSPFFAEGERGCDDSGSSTSLESDSPSSGGGKRPRTVTFNPRVRVVEMRRREGDIPLWYTRQQMRDFKIQAIRERDERITTASESLESPPKEPYLYFPKIKKDTLDSRKTFMSRTFERFSKRKASSLIAAGFFTKTQ